MRTGRKVPPRALPIVGGVGFPIAEGVRETGVHIVTPSELAAKAAPAAYDKATKG